MMNSRIAAAAAFSGLRSAVAVPMLRDGLPIGSIAVGRAETGLLPAKQVELLKTFADQAVIAIENVRLFDEVEARTRDLSEALQQQTATADVLKVISRSVFDLDSVLETLIKSAVDLCRATMGGIFLPSGQFFRLAAQVGMPAELVEYELMNPFVAGPGTTTGRVVLTRSVVHIPDVLGDAEYTYTAGQKFGDYRAMFGVPLIRDDEVVGVFSLARLAPGPFAPREIELVQTFADQAVMAIGNVRLFEEVQARTQELTEALEYQTATSEVLNVISRSPTNVQPVFEAIVKSASELFAPRQATIVTLHDGQLHWKATGARYLSETAIERAKAIYPIPFDPERSPSARAIQERRVIELLDAAAPDAPDFSQRVYQAVGFRFMCFVPLLREGVGIGSIVLAHPEPGLRLSAKQLALVQTFADQAVIAIENVRLFEEVQARTRDLQRGAATADGDRRGVAVDQPLGFRSRCRVRTLVRSAVRALRRLDGRHLPARGRQFIAPAQQHRGSLGV